MSFKKINLKIVKLHRKGLSSYIQLHYVEYERHRSVVNTKINIEFERKLYKILQQSLKINKKLPQRG
jgi:hypothetical protein